MVLPMATSCARNDTVLVVAVLVLPTYMSMAAAAEAMTVSAPPSIETSSPMPETIGVMTDTVPSNMVAKVCPNC